MLGVRGNACRDDVPDLTSADLKGLDKGMTADDVLRRLGQPDARQGDTFTFCVDGLKRTVEFADGRLRKA